MKNELTIKEQIEKFHHIHSVYITKEIDELSISFDKCFFDKNTDETLKLIERAKKIKENSLTLANKMQLNYDIATAYSDLRNIDHVDSYLEKEILHYRKVIMFYEENQDKVSNDELFVLNYIAMRTYTNLGNALKATGRYVASIDSFFNALSIEESFSMASLNLSRTLLDYSFLQTRKYEEQYYQHASYYYLEYTKKYDYNLENLEYLSGLKKAFSIFHKDYINNFLTKELKLPDYFIDDEKEKIYRNYIGLFRLFLDPCAEILADPCFLVDSLVLPFNAGEGKDEFIGLFNQLKSEYIHARYLWYISEDNNQKYFFEKDIDLVDIKDTANYSYNDTLMRMSFRIIYSAFDRIGFFINEYFNVGLKGSNVSFKNIWKEELKGRNGEIYFTIPNPLTKHLDNVGLKALYWLQKDLLDDKKVCVTDPYSIIMFKMRNDMEHNVLRTVDDLAINKTSKFTTFVTEGQIEHNVFRILKLFREALIYLVIAVNENLKKEKKRDLR